MASSGRTFVGFDSDGLHLRIAAFYSQDPFICGALEKYDLTRDPIWKPHIQNCCALFGITPEEAVHLMNIESAKYTFAKNFIYLILNGGDAPALANAAASAGLDFNIGYVKGLLNKWLEKAKRFKEWREGLLKEVRQTGAITLPDGRRRRFYDLTWKDGLWQIPYKTVKEIYNFPLIGTEVSYINPRILTVWRMTMGDWREWLLVYHGHDGFMVEGPIEEAKSFAKTVIEAISTPHEIGGRKLIIPWGVKGGPIWAELGKL